MLTEEEKKRREEEEAKKKEEETKAKEEEKKKEEEEFNKLEELGKIQATWQKKNEEAAKECEQRLTLKRLTKEQKLELFKTVRYSYLKHEELLALAINPVFDAAKNYIVEGLSVRLDSYENASKKDLQINIEPRVNYELNESAIQDKSKGGPDNFYFQMGKVQGPSNLG